jgi:hypothetical protein
VRTFAEVSAWCAGAAEEFGDPSLPICQLFFRWQGSLAGDGAELICGMPEDALVLLLGPGFPPLPLPVQSGEPVVDQDGELLAYGAERVTASVWAITPSLNAVGLIHAFIVLHGVPDPAPWERRIVLP